MKRKVLGIVMICAVLFTGYAGNTGESSKEAKETEELRVIQDITGREVSIPSEVKTVVAVGAASLRLVCYMESTNKIIGVEEIESKPTIGRPYSVAYPELSKLPAIGKGGGGGTVTYDEEILKLNPDVIIATFDEKKANDLSSKTGIPVVNVTYRGIFGDDMDKSLDIIADVFDKEKREIELITYMDGAEEDLNNRTKDIKDEDKKSVYTGAVSFNGQHGFDGTYGLYPPFTAINAKNVVDETGK